ncbi:MAG TPA: hypothetical protein VEY06_03580 [Flavisolibacter sp.]|nr:hypothetical protein [Flavisolibacter sp.]
MQEQNFEKEVRQKMDELLLQPSPPVWKKVKEEIGKKKEKRPFVFWLLPLFILGGAAGSYFYLIPSLKRDTRLNSSVPEYKMPGVVDQEETSHNKAVKENVAITGSINAKTDKEAVTGTTVNASRGKKGERFIKNYGTRLTGIASDKEQPALARYSTDNSRSDASPEAIQPSTLPRITTHSDSVWVPDKIIIEQKVDTQNLKQAVGLIPAIDSSVKTDSAHIKKHANTLKRKWIWSVYTGVGVSNTTTALFNNEQRFIMDYSIGTTSGTPSFGQGPSPVQKSIAYSIGVDAKRNLSKRLSLTAGLHYSRYSTKRFVGARNTSFANVTLGSNDSAKVNESYRPGRQQELTNKYHFVEIPVGIEFRIIKKLPLYLHSGLTIAQMIGSDAVVYDANNRIYYKADKAFNRTGVFYFSSINYTVYKNKTFSLNAGPYLQYGVTKLEKFGANKHHLYSAGIRMNISF